MMSNSNSNSNSDSNNDIAGEALAHARAPLPKTAPALSDQTVALRKQLR